MLTTECHVLPNKCGRSTGIENQHFAIIVVKVGSGKIYEWMLKSIGEEQNL